VSAFAFGGKPDEVVRLLLHERFRHVTSEGILAEVRRNLVVKLEKEPAAVDLVVAKVLAVSVTVQPQGEVYVTGYAPDDLVLEVAVKGRCDVLVTGDKRHLLPLVEYRGVAIEAPSAFLKRLESR